jgi:hypothetical protein
MFRPVEAGAELAREPDDVRGRARLGRHSRTKRQRTVVPFRLYMTLGHDANGLWMRKVTIPVNKLYS